MGAVDYRDGYIWGGLLNHARVDGEYDPSQNRSIIAKIRADNLEVVATWDITEDGLTWIDPVCFDGEHVWVSEMNNLGIHRFALVDGKLVHRGVLRYPREMSFSQGVRVVGDKLYTIHTFGEMDGLFEFQIPDTLSEAENQPTRVWEILETTSHLEGFDFIPCRSNQIWHAQGSQVDRYELAGLPSDTTR